MYIIFIILRNIVIEHRLHIVHINPPCSHIRSYQDLGPSLAEAVHHPIPLHLLQIPVQPFCKISSALQLFHQKIHLALGVAECHRKLRRIQIKQAAHHLHLGLWLHLIVVLRHLWHGQLLFHYPHYLRILLKGTGDL